MDKFQLELFVLTALLATCCTANQASISADLVNSNVDRTVDLSSHLPKITNAITVENTGKSSVNSYIYAVDANVADSLSFIGAVTKTSDEDHRLKVVKTTVANQVGKVFYRIDFASPLAAGQSVKIDVETFFPHTLEPYPSEIAQSEKQLVRFSTSAVFYSPYKTTTQKTTVNTVSSNIESYTKTVKPVSSQDNSISYGPFENKEPFTEAEISVHYENNSPFLAVTELDRLVELSHWGNIAVEETVDVRHTGALLKGAFSRYDYQRNQDGQASIKSFKTNLPAAARDVYYRDEIGNISTSNLREMDDSLEVELRPRFPLFGGWKSHYTLGYNVPSYQYLYNNGDKYVLKMRFVDHVYDDQVVDYATLRVILPEGCKVEKLVTPYDVKRSPDQLHYTYLDTTGRPVVIAHKSNLVDAHIQDFELHYTFSKTSMVVEPLLCVSAFYLLFLVVIIYVRLDFSITKDEATESRLRVAGLIEQIQGQQDRRSALYQSYDDAINKYKSSKDSTGFVAKRKAIDGDYKTLTAQIQGLLSKLKSEGSDAAEKVAELQHLDGQVRDQVNLAITYAEKLISGKMNKQQYVDVEATVRSKKEDYYGKMEVILGNL
jgi:oligosaccharyltransferase complex subunit alpha (ribophorin I)